MVINCYYLSSGKTLDNRLQMLYNNHGKCVVYYNQELNGKIKTPEKYLCTAAELAFKYNVGKYLRKFELGHELKESDIVDEISKETKVIPSIKTLYDKLTDKHYLHEVRFQLDENLNLVDFEGKKSTYMKCYGKYANQDHPVCPEESKDNSTSSCTSSSYHHQ